MDYQLATDTLEKSPNMDILICHETVYILFQSQLCFLQQRQQQQQQQQMMLQGGGGAGAGMMAGGSQGMPGGQGLGGGPQMGAQQQNVFLDDFDLTMWPLGEMCWLGMSAYDILFLEEFHLTVW